MSAAPPNAASTRRTSLTIDTPRPYPYPPAPNPPVKPDPGLVRLPPGKIRRYHPSEKVIRVGVGTRDGTARGGGRRSHTVDFTRLHLRLLRLHPGTIEATVRIPIRGDNEVEGDEFFLIGVSRFETPNRALGPTRPEVRVTIVDDD